MKRKLFFALILFIGLIIETKAMVLSPTSETSATPGSQIDVYITLTRTSSEKQISAVDGTFTYDENVLTLGSTQTILLSKWTELSEVSNSRKFSYANLTFDKLITDTSTNIVKLFFTVNNSASGNTTLSITNPMATDENGNSVTISGGSLNINIQAETPKSTDNNLKSLKIDGVSVNNFSASTLSYSKTVENSISTVNIEAVANDSKASVEGDGLKVLNVGDNVFTIRVTSEAGSTKNYTVTVTRKEALSTNNNLKSLKIDGVSVDNFSASTLTYSKSYANSKTSINIEAEASDTKAIVNGTGTKNLTVGNNTFEISVISESGSSKVYTLNITREAPKSTDVSLKSLKIDGVSVDNFSASTLSYSKTYDNSKTSISIEAEANDSKSTVTGTGSKNLTVGNNTFQIKVTSEAGSTQTYTLNITRKQALSTDNNLKSLKIDGVSVDNFSPSTLSYSKVYGASKTSVNIEAVANDSKATVTGAGTKTLQDGNNTFTISVTSESGSIKKYTITITKAETKPSSSDINTLESISIDGNKISEFNANTKTYSYKTSNNTIKIEAVKTDSKSVVKGLGTYALQMGINSLKIKVTSESGITNIYTINVTKEEVKQTGSNINTLKTLSLDKGTIVFNSNTLTYNVTVDSDVTKVKISSTLTDSKSSYVKGYGNREVNLNYGKNTYMIKVEAENKEIKTYVLNITRKDNRSSDNNLKTLIVTGANISFDPNVLEYDLEVTSSEVEIKSTLSDQKAKYVKDYGNRKVEILDGTNTVLIKVEAENGSIKTYTLNINKKIEDKKLLITSLKIRNYKLEFQSETYDYSLPIKDETKLNFTIKLSRTDANYEIIGNENLENGSIIVIRIKTNDNLETKDYRINIIKDETPKEVIDVKENETTKEKNNYTIPIIIAAVGLSSLAIAIILKKIKK